MSRKQQLIFAGILIILLISLISIAIEIYFKENPYTRSVHDVFLENHMPAEMFTEYSPIYPTSYSGSTTEDQSSENIEPNIAISLTPLVTTDPNTTPTITSKVIGLPTITTVGVSNPTVTPTRTNTPTVAPIIPHGQTGLWNMIFYDEFNVTGINLSKWEPSWFTGSNISQPVNSLEDSCYDPAQVNVSGGSLKLTAVTTSNPSCHLRNGAQASYASGLINSRNSFTYAYGYMEARIYLPGSGGSLYNWPAFWSTGTGTWPVTGEIDVMEGLSAHIPCWYYHYQDIYGVEQGPGGCVNMDATGWHVYGAYWEPGRITFYYDGVQVGTITSGVVNANHYLILNYGIDTDFGVHVPSTMEVDYVRVWKKN